MSENNREIHSFVLNVPAAKYILAKNDIGKSYFQYLLQCEQIASEAQTLLEMQGEQIEKLQANISAYQKKVARKRKSYISTVKFVNTQDMFGIWWTEIEAVKKPREQASPRELAESEFVQNTKIQEGLAKKQSEFIKSGVIHPVADQRKLPPGDDENNPY